MKTRDEGHPIPVPRGHVASSWMPLERAQTWAEGQEPLRWLFRRMYTQKRVCAPIVRVRGSPTLTKKIPYATYREGPTATETPDWIWLGAVTSTRAIESTWPWLWFWPGSPIPRSRPGDGIDDRACEKEQERRGVEKVSEVEEDIIGRMTYSWQDMFSWVEQAMRLSGWDWIHQGGLKEHWAQSEEPNHRMWYWLLHMW